MPRLLDVYRFTVTGSGVFPLDMLRYDRCWPASGKDTAKALRGRGSGERAVALEGLGEPTGDRWRSFGWTIS